MGGIRAILGDWSSTNPFTIRDGTSSAEARLHPAKSLCDLRKARRGRSNTAPSPLVIGRPVLLEHSGCRPMDRFPATSSTTMLVNQTIMRNRAAMEQPERGLVSVPSSVDLLGEDSADSLGTARPTVPNSPTTALKIQRGATLPPIDLGLHREPTISPTDLACLTMRRAPTISPTDLEDPILQRQLVSSPTELEPLRRVPSLSSSCSTTSYQSDGRRHCVVVGGDLSQPDWDSPPPPPPRLIPSMEFGKFRFSAVRSEASSCHSELSKTWKDYLDGLYSASLPPELNPGLWEETSSASGSSSSGSPRSRQRQLELRALASSDASRVSLAASAASAATSASRRKPVPNWYHNPSVYYKRFPARTAASQAEVSPSSSTTSLPLTPPGWEYASSAGSSRADSLMHDLASWDRDSGLFPATTSYNCLIYISRPHGQQLVTKQPWPQEDPQRVDMTETLVTPRPQRNLGTRF